SVSPLRPSATCLPSTTLFRSPVCPICWAFRFPPVLLAARIAGLHPRHCRILALGLADGGECTAAAPCPWPRRTVLARLRSEPQRSEEHTSELQSRENLVCRLL